jgi:hypothetical protein
VDRPTNRLIREINQQIQDWRSRDARHPGVIQSTNDLIRPAKIRPGLSECHQIDFIQKVELPDLSPHMLNLYEGNPCFLLRNLSTASGLVKGRRYWAVDLNERVVVMKLDTKEELTLFRIPIEKVSNGIKFARWQIPIQLIYADTVHSSQGMTLDRAVIDLRTNFWEHGQLYVALSRVTQPVNLCFLLPFSSDLRCDIDPAETPIRIRVDVDIAQIISRLCSRVGADHVVS